MSAHAVFRIPRRAQRAALKFLSTLAFAALTLLGAAQLPAFANTGLKGDYYHGRNFETFVTSRIDPTVDFDWGNGSPIPGTVNVDNFSVRWTGYVVTTNSGEYTFEAVGDDGIRLWVNDQQVVNAWVDQGPTAYQGKIHLAGGTRYKIRFEYYENGGGAVARLRWQPPGAGSVAAIPSANLDAPADNIVAVPVVDPSNALVTGAVEVSMSTATANAAIYYTVNTALPLTTPTTSSSLYTGPFSVAVNGPTYVTARAMKDGMLDTARTVVFVPGALDFSGGFNDITNIVLNGSAAKNGSMIRLTGDLWDKTASFFSKGTVDITGFTSTFTFTQVPGDTGAEGLMFVMQGTAANALGGAGNGMGFTGIGNSVGIKFDLYKNNSTADPSNSSTGIYLNGASPFGGSDLLPDINLRSGNLMKAEVAYDGATLTVKLTDTVTTKSVTKTYPVNIPATVGGKRAFLGFTATTNSFFTAVQDIRTWTYAFVASAATVSGDITLEDSTNANVPLTFNFRPSDNSGVVTRTVTPAADGTFSVSVPRKNYVVSIKGARWLRKNVAINVSSGDSTGNNITLLGGDANNDNSIDVLDLDALIQAFDSATGDPNWNNGAADFNNDGSVDVLDLDLLIRNFDKVGDD